MPWKYASSGLVLAAIMLAGCSGMSGSSKPADEPVAASGGDRCNADAVKFAIGKPASAALLEQARVKSGAQTARLVGPNDMITLEYRSDRLNLNTDNSATVDRVNCG